MEDGLYGSAQRDPFSDPSRIHDPCLVATPPADLYHLMPDFTSRRCKARCADENDVAWWNGKKNEVATFSRDAKINTAGSPQAVNIIGFAKKQVVMSLHSFSIFLGYCLISRKVHDSFQTQMCCIHNCITYHSAGLPTCFHQKNPDLVRKNAR